MATVTLATYNCKQGELYTICNLGWDACAANLAAFAGLSAVYTAPFVSAKKAAIIVAANLPDFQARNSIAEIIRLALAADNVQVLNFFQRLKHYISVAFPGVQWQIAWDAAGWGHYAAARKEDWDSTALMLISMNNYVTANSAALLAGANMPAGFAAGLTTLTASFTANHYDYVQAREAAALAAEIKLEANNAIYTDLMTMFGAAKLLGFSAALIKQFTFASLLQLISGAGTSGITGFVMSAATGDPIENASLKILSLGIHVFSNSDGSYTLSSIPSGNYIIEVSAPNPTIGPSYITQSVPVTVNLGTISALDFSLLQ